MARPSQLLGLCGLSIGKLVGHRAHDGGIADGAVVERIAINYGDGVQQPARFNLGNNRIELGADACIIDIAVYDASVVTKSTAQFSANNGGDLLRRP